MRAQSRATALVALVACAAASSVQATPVTAEHRALAKRLAALDTSRVLALPATDDVPALVALLQDGEPLLARAGALGLEALGTDAAPAEAALRRALGHSDAGVRLIVREALTAFDPGSEDVVAWACDPLIPVEDVAAELRRSPGSVPTLLAWTRTVEAGCLARTRAGVALRSAEATSASVEQWEAALDLVATRGAAALALARHGDAGRAVLRRRLASTSDDAEAWALATALASAPEGLAEMPSFLERGTDATKRGALLVTYDDDTGLLGAHLPTLLSFVEPPASVEELPRWFVADFYPEVAATSELAELAIAHLEGRAETYLLDALDARDVATRRRAAWFFGSNSRGGLLEPVVRERLSRALATDRDSMTAALALHALLVEWDRPEAERTALGRKSLFDRRDAVRDLAARMLEQLLDREGWMRAPPLETRSLLAAVAEPPADEEECLMRTMGPPFGMLDDLDDGDAAFAAFAHARVDFDTHPSRVPLAMLQVGENVLVRASRSDDPLVRLAALHALHGFEQPPAASEAVARAGLADRVPVVRVAALELLASVVPEERVVPEMMPFAQDDQAAVRAAAASRLGGAQADTLRSMLADPSANVRLAAFRALANARLVDRNVVAALLVDPSPEVRRSALLAADRSQAPLVVLALRLAADGAVTFVDGWMPHPEPMALAALAIPEAVELAASADPRLHRLGVRYLSSFACRSCTARRALVASACDATTGAVDSSVLPLLLSNCDGEHFVHEVATGPFRPW